MLTLFKHHMQSINPLININLSRIRTMIQHPVNNLNPSSQILIMKRREQKLFPIDMRVFLNR